jgi:sporulation protein YlmC with PRC-barrel domain
MRKFTATLATLFLVFCLSWPVAAQQQDPQELRDKQVLNEQGEEIGSIEEVITAPDGSIEAVVVRKGGFLGLGGEEETIPWNALKKGEDPNSMVYVPGLASQEQQAQAGAGGRQEQPQAADQQGQALQGRQPADQEREQARGEVTVQQPAPKVAVEQSPPRVQVDQPPPQVQVQQPPPQVTVKQPPPQVEVRVHQPEPQVEVQQQQPRVAVEQAEPRVGVEQAEPDVKVQQEEPKVAVKKGEPQVQVGRGQPQVYVEKQQQADVQVQRGGEPQVRVLPDQKMAQQQGQAQRPAQAVEASKAEEWLNRKIVGRNGQELGTVENTYLSEDGNTVLYVIVRGKENRMHPVPVGMVREDREQGQLVAQIDKETFDRSPNFIRQQAPKLDQQPWSPGIHSYYQMEGGGQQPAGQPGSAGTQQDRKGSKK